MATDTRETKFDIQLYHKVKNYFLERQEERWINDVDEVFPNVFVSNEFFARTPEDVKSAGITHVLNLAIEDVQTGPEFYEDIGVNYIGIFAEDDPEFDLKKLFNETAEIIHKAVQSGDKILVHCVAGYRRSPTIAIAYMMIKHKKHLWDVVVEARSNRKIFPNDGFIEQLCMLEKELYG